MQKHEIYIVIMYRHSYYKYVGMLKACTVLDTQNDCLRQWYTYKNIFIYMPFNINTTYHRRHAEYICIIEILLSIS